MKKVMLLSNNENAKVLFDRLQAMGNDVILYHEPITEAVLDEYAPDIVVSYNYQHIVKEDVINRMGDCIINLHTSYLPWNKGASPNVWSFIDDTPKGVTIHRLEKGLDVGKIIVQKELFFDENTETLSGSYARLNEEIVNLLLENWDMIASGNYVLKEQQGKGSYHRSADLKKLLNGKEMDYSMTIRDFKKYITE